MCRATCREYILIWKDFRHDLAENLAGKSRMCLLLARQMRGIYYHIAEHLRIVCRCISDKGNQIILFRTRLLLRRTCLTSHFVTGNCRAPAVPPSPILSGKAHY